jgi:hypothetical protein
VNVDGDDWLSSSDALSEVNSAYQDQETILTYGDCIYFSPGKGDHLVRASETNQYINHRYLRKVEQKNSYRKEIFNPLHMRTWKTDAFKAIPKPEFLRPDGTWIRCCEDQAIFFPLLEMATGNYKVLEKPLYFYNLENPLSDAKVNVAERLYDEVLLRKKKNG